MYGTKGKSTTPRGVSLSGQKKTPLSKLVVVPKLKSSDVQPYPVQKPQSKAICAAEQRKVALELNRSMQEFFAHHGLAEDRPQKREGISTTSTSLCANKSGEAARTPCGKTPQKRPSVESGNKNSPKRYQSLQLESTSSQVESPRIPSSMPCARAEVCNPKPERPKPLQTIEPNHTPSVNATPRSREILRKSLSGKISKPSSASTIPQQASRPSTAVHESNKACFAQPKSKTVTSIDLTGGSDSDPEDDCPSRQDLLRVTGSLSTGVDRADFKPASSTRRFRTDVDLREAMVPGLPRECRFLENDWVGNDQDVCRVCKLDSAAGSAAEAGRLSARFGKDFVLGSVEAPRIGSFVLTAGDLECLEGPRWLNDEVVNAYMCVLQIRSNVAASSAATTHSEEGVGDADGLCQGHSTRDRKEGELPEAESELSGNEKEGQQDDSCSATDDHRSATETDEGVKTRSALRQAAAVGVGSAAGAPPRCLFFNSFFYALLRNAKGGYSYDRVQRWGRRVNLAEYDEVFFPINVGNTHWCLAVVSPQRKAIRYYDSLGGSNAPCLNLLEKYLNDEGKARGVEALCGQWAKSKVGPPAVPAQSDGCSCGLFVCAYADCLSAPGGVVGGFTQEDMGAFRRTVLRFLASCRM